jgi:uncharacterized membrane protein YhhN
MRSQPQHHRPRHRLPGTLLPAATVVAALLAMLAEPLGQPWLAFVFKPLASMLVIAYAWRRGAAAPAMRRWLRAGLVLGLLGDIALLWPQQGFVPGLGAFLLGHLCYIAAFTRDVRFGARPLAFAGYAVAAGGVLAFLWPDVPGELKLPVGVYVLCLSAMAAQAAARALQLRQRLAGIAALGAGLFVVSDALIAIDRFHAPLPAATALILSTYWVAQWCIASALPPSR